MNDNGEIILQKDSGNYQEVNKLRTTDMPQETDKSLKADKSPEIIYSPEKDFYRGVSGELRYKAEGLFKKAKEKGISIDEIAVEIIKENKVGFPGVGEVELPAFLVKVKGRDTATGQVITDAKQIDYYNRYQKYLADKIMEKNTVKDERGRIARENGKPVVKDEADFILTEWEKFIISKSIIDDKEFGLEKTITGACDRVIRKLMGENDWLYPDEARLLDEEFNTVKSKIEQSSENRNVFERRERIDNRERSANIPNKRKATERQINFLKAKIKNSGLNPDNPEIIHGFIRESGYSYNELEDLSVSEISGIIDNFNSVLQRIKERIPQTNYNPGEYGGISVEPPNETEIPQ